MERAVLVHAGGGRAFTTKNFSFRSKCLCRRRFPEICPVSYGSTRSKSRFSKTGDPHFLRSVQAGRNKAFAAIWPAVRRGYNAGNATGKWPLSSQIKPGARTRLIVVDVQNDFCPGGRLGCRKATRWCPW